MNTKPIPTNSFIFIGVLAGLVAALDIIGVIGFPIGVFGVSGFYIGAAFFTAFAIWFKWRGLLAIYLGLIVAAFFQGSFSIFTPALALGNVIGSTVPLFVFRYTKASMYLEDKKDYASFILSAAIGQSCISAIWVLTGFYLVGFLPAEGLVVAFSGWIIGGFIVELLIGIPLLKKMSSFVQKLPVYAK